MFSQFETIQGIQFEIIEGTPGVTLDDAAHIVPLGRGRDITGMGLSPMSEARVRHAAELWAAEKFEERGGRFICSTKHTPGDRNGKLWVAPDGEEYTGIPEADSMDLVLDDDKFLKELQARYGRVVEPKHRHIERRSIDTVTNLAELEARDMFGEGDMRPVIFVAQREHLIRTLKQIAPRVARRPYMGLVAPEVEGFYDNDTRLAALFSWTVLRRISAERQSAEIIRRKTSFRVRMLWGGFILANYALGRGDINYNTPTTPAAEQAA